MQKYKLTDKTKTLKTGTKLYQIQAQKDFGDVKAGDLGGWLEEESNLSLSSHQDHRNLKKI